MKSVSLTKHLPLITLGAGIAGALLRFWLYASGVDEKGLLVAGHPANSLFLVLTIAVAAVLVIGCLPLKQATKSSYNFPASVISAVGCVFAAVGVLMDALNHTNGSTLETITFIMGIFSAAALVFVGFCRLKGRFPSVLFHGLICLYLMLELVGLYQTWSSSPQLQDYAFSLLGCVCVMLACYHDAAFAAQSGSRQLHTFFHLAAAYLCFVSLPENDSFFFYLTLGVWMFTDLCNLTPYIRKPEAAPEV